MDAVELTYWTEVLAEETGVPVARVARAREGFALLLELEDGRSLELPVVELLSRREFERACAAQLGLLPTRQVRPSRWREIVRGLTAAG